MTADPEPLPSRSQLYWGAILVTIAHALWIAADPLLANEAWWDSECYLRNDNESAYGAIAFGPDHVVGLFFDLDSPRNPLRGERADDEGILLTGMPEKLVALAYEQLVPRLMFWGEGRAIVPITAAFWSNGDDLTSAEPWSEVIKHGAHLVATEVRAPDEALTELQENYQLSEGQVALLWSLYRRRREAPQVHIILNDHERATLLDKGGDGLRECRTLLAAVGITA